MRARSCRGGKAEGGLRDVEGAEPFPTRILLVGAQRPLECSATPLSARSRALA